jgi:diguanylate cyclase (GGDEF)-like protein
VVLLACSCKVSRDRHFEAYLKKNVILVTRIRQVFPYHSPSSMELFVSSSSPASPYNRSSAWLWSVFVGVVGIAFALLAGMYHRNAEVEEHQAEFERKSAFVYNSIRQQVEAGGQLTRSVQAAFMVSGTITQAELDRMYASLKPRGVLPGLKAMTYARKIPGRSGQPDRYLTEFVAPREGNENVVGLFVEIPGNLETIHRSEQLHTPVMSPVFRFRKEAEPFSAALADGVMIRVPIYEKNDTESRNSVGSVGVSFHLKALIDEALLRAEDPDIIVQLVDATVSEGPVIYQSGAPGLGMQRVEKMNFGARSWEIVLSQAHAAAAISIWPYVTVGGGIITAFLFAALIFSILSTRARAEALALDMGRKYKSSEERFRLLNEHLPGLVVLADEQGRLLYANRVSHMRLNIPEEGGDLASLFSLSHADLQKLRRDDHRIRLLDRNGHHFWISLCVSSLLLDGKTHLLGLGSDITDIMELSEQLEFQAKQLEFQATHDTLTGLPNRRSFEDSLEKAIVDFHEGSNPPVLLYIDLDQFKIVNDTAGHMAGDHLLMKASDGLRQLLMGDVVFARLGGDEFGVLMPFSTRDKGCELAEDIRRFFDSFLFEWEEVGHRVSCSIGINVFDQGQTRTDFLARADTACYLAKEKGRNRWHVFESAGDSESALRQMEMGWVARIRSAIEEDRLSLYYQDLVPLGKHDDHGAHFELLVRMHDADGNVVAASEFIPAAERYGLMDQVDRWVLEKALMNFDHLHPLGMIETCAINLSAQTISDPAFEEFLVQTLERSQVLPQRICLEITETSAIKNMDILASFIPSLRSRGCRIALDDFGAGMSSFGYLKNLQADIVKIDGSFVRDVDHDAKSQAIVHAVISIAHEMGMEVVAEWITSQAVLDKVAGLGVDYGQGYFLGQPQPCPIPAKKKS